MCKKTILLTFASLALLFGFSSVALACSCIHHNSPMLSEFANAKGVFIGKVVSVSDIPKQVRKERDTSDDIWVTYKIETAFKGIPTETKLITLEADYKGSSCGFHVAGRNKPRIGQRWIVFGFGSSKSPQLQLGAQCTKSTTIDSKKDLAELKKQLEKAVDIPGIAVGIVNSFDFMKKVDVIEVIVEGDGFRRIAETDHNGIYHFPNLSPGIYTVKLKLPPDAELYMASKRHPKTNRLTVEGPLELSYEVELDNGNYDYNEIQINLKR